MVLAAHHYTQSDLTTPSRSPDELKKFALRALIVSSLLKSWRDFGVNHCRAVSALILDKRGDKLTQLDSLRPDSPGSCIDETVPSMIEVDTYVRAK